MSVYSPSRNRITSTDIIFTGREVHNFCFSNIIPKFYIPIPITFFSLSYSYRWHTYCIRLPRFSLHSKYGYLALSSKHFRSRWRRKSYCRRQFLGCVIVSLIEMSSFCMKVSLWPIWVLRRVHLMVPVCVSACLWRVGKHMNNKRLNYFVCHYE